MKAKTSIRMERRYFTLIELLVVVSIIAILAAMLLPVLSKAKNQARNVICMGNLKQHGIAMIMYTNDFDDYYYWRKDVGFYGANALSSWLDSDKDEYFDIHEVVESYIPPSEVYVCPFDGRNRSLKWEDRWPGTGPNYWETGHMFIGYRIFANFTSLGPRTYFKLDGTATKYGTLVMPRKITETSKEGRPIMGDEVVEHGGDGIGVYFNGHSYNYPIGGVPRGRVSGNFLYADGSVEHHTNDNDFIKVYSEGWLNQAKSWTRLWVPR